MQAGHIENFKLMVASGADINAADYDKRTCVLTPMLLLHASACLMACCQMQDFASIREDGHATMEIVNMHACVPTH